MKKVVLVAALALGGLTAFAAAPVTVNNDLVITIQDEYQEIAVEEVPAAIQEALAADYPEATISKAYKNAEGTYKLDVQIGEQAGTLFANENGEWITE